MTSRFLRKLAARKGLDPDVLATGWGGGEQARLASLLAQRLLRGLLVKPRLGSARGWVLADRRVRLYHPGHIHAGSQFSLEEGCEIVGLSKQGIRFGDRCTVGRFASIRPTNVLLDEPGEGMRVGSHSNIGAYSYIGCSGWVEIGEGVLMGPRVSLLAENHHFTREDIPMREQGVYREPIVIEDDCWIGAGSTVLAGVTVGKGSVIAAGAVVTRDVSPGSIVGGVPAKVLRPRIPEHGA